MVKDRNRMDAFNLKPDFSAFLPLLAPWPAWLLGYVVLVCAATQTYISEKDDSMVRKILKKIISWRLTFLNKVPFETT